MRCSDRLYSPVSVLSCGVLFHPVRCNLYLNIVHTIRLCSCGKTPGLFSIAVYSRILVYPCLPSQKKKTPGTNNSRRPYVRKEHNEKTSCFLFTLYHIDIYLSMSSSPLTMTATTTTRLIPTITPPINASIFYHPFQICVMHF